LINTFAQVGWFDPFAHEETFTATFVEPELITDMVYHQDRLIPGFIPWAIYIPRREIMFKMMRACIGIKDKHQLWYIN
jgi:hypothetical protein